MDIDIEAVADSVPKRVILDATSANIPVVKSSLSLSEM